MATKRKNKMKRDGETRSSTILTMIDRPATNPSDVALLWGIAWLIIASIVGWYFKIAPSSSFGFVTTGYVSLTWHVVANAIVWVVSCVLPFTYAVLLNRNTRVVELFGRMLFAHWPVTLLMLPALIGDKIAYTIFMAGLRNFDLATSYDVQPIYSLLMTVIVGIVMLWYLYWSYLAFRKSSQRGGLLVFVGFLAVMIGSYYLSSMTLESVYESIFR